MFSVRRLLQSAWKKRCLTNTGGAGWAFPQSRGVHGATNGSRPPAKAVVFDLGGVISACPFELFRQIERENNLKEDTFRATVKAAGTNGSHARLERGEITTGEFPELFVEEYKQHWGVTVDPSVIAMLISRLKELIAKPRQEVLDVAKTLAGHGIKVAVLTNNYKEKDGLTWLPPGLSEVFDVVIESAKLGISKPDPAIFKVLLKRLKVEGEETIFLDDIGSNLKPATNIFNMDTIKVEEANITAALKELEYKLGVRLVIPGTTCVSEKQKLPVEKLQTYLLEKHDLKGCRSPTIKVFKHGQSNPTYYVSYAGRDLVLRKKPPGKLLPSAHAVEREYRVMHAMQSAGVPVPPLYSLCEDSSVVGTPFYLMEYVSGRLFKDPSLEEVPLEQRKDYYYSMIDTLTAIHSVDIDTVGLHDFGRHGNYILRQTERWSKQYVASKTRDIPAMDKLMQWLLENAPGNPQTTVVHGDYRIDNLIFDHDNPQVIAVLDWELSTLGDPLSDLAYCCMPYYLEPHHPALRGFSGRNVGSMGIPCEDDLLQRYCELTGTPDIPDWKVYMAFSFFRVAAILQGVYKRSLQAQSSADNAKEVGAMAEGMAKKAWHFAQSSTGSSATPPKGRRSYSTASGPSVNPGLLTGDVDDFPPRLQELHTKVKEFIHSKIIPLEHEVMEYHDAPNTKWTVCSKIEQLKSEANKEGLWNLFLPLETDPDGRYGSGLTNLEYSHLCELMGWSPIIAPEVFNCNAPDTGNMEVLVKYGNEEQKRQWLTPLLQGKIRSCFAMTEPAVASSDATNIQSEIHSDGDHYVLNGHKWWISGAVHPNCSICIFMGKTDPSAAKHRQQSMILVPMETPGIKIVRPLTVYGYDDAPYGHAEMLFDNVRVPKENMLLGEGRGFEIAQGRLGPGRIHHCMRLIGMVERSLEAMKDRVKSRTAFGKLLSERDTVIASIAQSRMEIEQARLLTLKAAHKMDTTGNKAAKKEIAMIKVVAPTMAQLVIDRAIQVHGAKGLSSDTQLARMFSWARILRLADGPDEVHTASIGKMELGDH